MLSRKSKLTRRKLRRSKPRRNKHRRNKHRKVQINLNKRNQKNEYT